MNLDFERVKSYLEIEFTQTQWVGGNIASKEELRDAIIAL